MTKSREQLVSRALEELGVLAAGQAPSAEDAQTIDDEIDPVLEDLASRNIYTYGDLDSIDDNAFVHLAILLANSKAKVFGSMPDEGVRMLAETRLRMLTPAVVSGQPIRVEYY